MEFVLVVLWTMENQNRFFKYVLFCQSHVFLHTPHTLGNYCVNFAGNDTQYCHCCTPQSQFIYPEPDYSLDFNSPQDLHNLQQQNLCCENIEEVEFDPEGDILFLESLLYDNSSPRPPEALQANSNAIESLPPSHIPVWDNDSLMAGD
ncbi:hypothetical protein Tco_0554071 [Tanacetum coccineum]